VISWNSEVFVASRGGIFMSSFDVRVFEWIPGDWDKETGQVTNVDGEVWFTAQAFHCLVSKLRLGTEAEIDAAGSTTAWQIEDADWRDYETDYNDDDSRYEHWPTGNEHDE
jgi:hypothetical protein